MPAARLLGRRWMFATDDLVFPCIMEIPYRLIWFVLMILVIRDSGAFPCYDSGYAKFFAGGTLTLQLLMMVVLAATAQQSARGSLTEVDKRKYVGPLLICKLFLLLVEIGLNLMGVVWIFFGAVLCRVTPFSKTLLECILILSWIPLLLIGLAVYIAYDPLGTLDYAELQTDEEKEFYHKKFTQIMAGRVQWTFWFFRDNKMKEAVMEMASLLSILFRSTDLVLYDLIAGSILLRVRQKRETRSLRESQSQVDMAEIDYTTDMRKISEEVPSWMTMEEALHYLKFATAAYGGLFVLYRYYCAGFCFLIPYLRCCCWRPQHVMGDNCCMCNYAGLKYISEITDKDFIYVSYENHIFEVPFYVLAEHSRKRIVVTVRGSLTLHDMFTDLAGAAQKFEAEGLPSDSLAHKGMVLGTEKTLERLTPILESAFEEYPDYELVITGHSLGAAVSTLLGIKLKSKYPHLRVFAFSTPSGLLTREAARYTESFVLTVGVGDDVVMRLSVTSAQMFRDRLIETMHMTRLPKYRILLKGLQYMFFKIPDSDLTSIWKPTDDLEADLVGPPRRLVRSISYDLEKLYVGGRILHIIPHRPALTNRSVLKSESKYKMRWANPEEFAELTVTPSMLSDHMPQNIEGPLRHIVEALSRSATVPLSTPDTP